MEYAARLDIVQAVAAEFNGDSRHVHPLVNFPPKVAVSRLASSLQSVSPQDAAGIPRPASPLLAREPAVVPGSYSPGPAGGAPTSVQR